MCRSSMCLTIHWLACFSPTVRAMFPAVKEGISICWSANGSKRRLILSLHGFNKEINQHSNIKRVVSSWKQSRPSTDFKCSECTECSSTEWLNIQTPRNYMLHYCGRCVQKRCVRTWCSCWYYRRKTGASWSRSRCAQTPEAHAVYHEWLWKPGHTDHPRTTACRTKQNLLNCVQSIWPLIGLHYTV